MKAEAVNGMKLSLFRMCASPSSPHLMALVTKANGNIFVLRQAHESWQTSDEDEGCCASPLPLNCTNATAHCVLASIAELV